jgi:HlyD family secretion protein
MRHSSLLAIVPFIALVACSRTSGDQGDSPYAFRTGVADRGDIQVTVEETGVVTPDRQVAVKSPISGIVRQLLVREGDEVRPGQLLATIVPDINQANVLAALRSELALSRMNSDNARREAERARALTVGSTITQEQLDAKHLALEQSENTLRRVRDQFRLLEESGVIANDSLQLASIRAPVAGVVIRRGAEQGETVVGGTNTVGGGTELFVIADLAVLVVKAAINEVDIGKVRRGDRVQLTVDAFPDDTVSGMVRLIPPAAQLKERVRVFDVEVEVRGRQRVLRPGMTANVRIAGPTHRNVIRVPVEAVIFQEGSPVVFKASGGASRAVPVRLGLSNVTHVEIVGPGILPGDTVALEDPAAAAARPQGTRRGS